jgi:ribosomal protein L7/L12
MNAHGQAIKVLAGMTDPEFKKMAYTFAEKHPVSFLRANGIIPAADKVVVPGLGEISKFDFARFKKVAKEADHPITAIKEVRTIATGCGLREAKDFCDYVRSIDRDNEKQG